MYPALNAMLDPKDGIDHLYRTSRFFRNEKDFCFATTGGREKDNQPAEPMYESDLICLMRACPPTPKGYRSSAYLAVSWELGHRPALFLMAFPGNVHLIHGNVWRFDGMFDVKTNNRYKDYNLAERAAEEVENFKRCEDMCVWGTVNRAFHFKDVVALDNDINERSIHGGFPLWWFSSYGPRRGNVSESVANLMFGGHTKEEAMKIVAADIGWASSADTIQDYITPLGKSFCSLDFVFLNHLLKPPILFCQVRRVEEIIDDGLAHLYPNGTNSMSLVEKHPRLAQIPGFLVGPNNDQLPGPFRQRRVCNNDGVPPDFVTCVNFIWMQVRPAGAPAGYMFAGNDLMNRMPRLATNFWAHFGPVLHPSWDVNVFALRQRWNGGLMALNKARGTFLNILIRHVFLTQAMVAAGVFPAVPARVRHWVSLPQAPAPFSPPRRPLMHVRANPSSSLVYAREHELRRVRPRLRRTVWYDGQEHRLVDLTRTQCALLDQFENPENTMTVGVGWLWAATQP